MKEIKVYYYDSDMDMADYPNSETTIQNMS
jgi:hypothetical protein